MYLGAPKYNCGKFSVKYKLNLKNNCSGQRMKITEKDVPMRNFFVWCERRQQHVKIKKGKT